MKKKKLIEIIYEDANIFVINKPTGVSVTKDRSGKEDITAMLAKERGPQELRLVHRLDKGTSGVMLFAKTAAAQSYYSSAFEKRKTDKLYLALVNGIPMSKSGVIKQPIAVDRKEKNKMKISPKRGKEAITKWYLLADFGLSTLLAVRPMTGRTHQIRVHMKNAGMPLVIDKVYGGTRAVMLSDYKDKYRRCAGTEELPLLDRLSLHAYQLGVEMENSEQSVFTAGLDRKFRGCIKMLTKHNKSGEKAFGSIGWYEAIINGQVLDI